MKKPPQILLASASPRRSQMLRDLGIPFRVCTPDVSEEWSGISSVSRIAREIAKRKARKCESPDHLVIAMDTLVIADKRNLGKPGTRQEALEMLKLLSNQRHSVVTGVALFYKKRLLSDSETTQVFFRKIEPTEMDWYVDSNEPYDKAGGYAIQGAARIFTTRIEGCYYNVIGFPLSCFQRLLKRFGFTLLDFIR